MANGRRSSVCLCLGVALLAAAPAAIAAEPETTAAAGAEQAISKAWLLALRDGRAGPLPAVFRIEPIPAPTPPRTTLHTRDRVRLGLLPSLSEVRAVEALGLERFVTRGGGLQYTIRPEQLVGRQSMEMSVQPGQNAYGLTDDFWGPSASHFRALTEAGLDGVVGVRTATAPISIGGPAFCAQ